MVTDSGSYRLAKLPSRRWRWSPETHGRVWLIVERQGREFATPFDAQSSGLSIERAFRAGIVLYPFDGERCQFSSRYYVKREA